MDAALETIGARCETCHLQDFLPFACPHCHLAFCLEHASQAAHGCKVVPAAAAVVNAQPEGQTSSSSLKQLQQDHLARRFTPSSPVRTPARTAAASVTPEAASLLAGLKTRLGRTFALRDTGKADPRRTLADAKLRREAKGDAAIPQAQRLTLRVAYGDRKEAVLFVNGDWSVGRAMDAVAKRLDVTNENASTRDEARRLHLWHDGLLLEPSQRMGSRVPDLGQVVLFRGLDRPVR